MNRELPTVIVTGMKRSGLNLIADMLREGGIPDEPFRIVHDLRSPIVASSGLAIAPDPHKIRYLPLHPKRRVGLFIERSSGAIIDSLDRENMRNGGTKLARLERNSLLGSMRYEFKRCRDAAAADFSPMFMFTFDQIIADPQRTAERFAQLLAQFWPSFDERRAALAVRRIVHMPRPERLKPHLRLVETA